jgi:hypothetical protein
MTTTAKLSTGGAPVNDIDIRQRIGALVDEEHHLERPGGGLSEDEQARRTRIEVALDQCWDLLRQRRTRRAAGDDPEGASERGEGVVEGYRQ